MATIENENPGTSRGVFCHSAKATCVERGTGGQGVVSVRHGKVEIAVFVENAVASAVEEDKIVLVGSAEEFCCCFADTGKAPVFDNTDVLGSEHAGFGVSESFFEVGEVVRGTVKRSEASFI